MTRDLARFSDYEPSRHQYQESGDRSKRRRCSGQDRVLDGEFDLLSA